MGELTVGELDGAEFVGEILGRDVGDVEGVLIGLVLGEDNEGAEDGC